MTGATAAGDEPRVAVIVVTFNSGAVLPRCMQALMAQTRRADRVILVDNHSQDAGYLSPFEELPGVDVLRLPVNEGFCGGNNRGYARSTGVDYVLFLNPDAFLTPSFIEEALGVMQGPASAGFAAITGLLLGVDVGSGLPTGRIDSTGIFQTWYGKWFDRGQGSEFHAPDATAPAIEEVGAICGALMFCRREALEQSRLGPDAVFDPGFFMYKEDIDLSLRLRRQGWKLGYRADLRCYHGRGWSGRQRMSRRARYLSARNELRVALRNRGRGAVYSAAKLLYVVCIEALRDRGPH